MNFIIQAREAALCGLKKSDTFPRPQKPLPSSPRNPRSLGPAWLPAAFQHVSYLVAPPKTKAQLEQEQIDWDQNVIREDPMVNVDMTPWWLGWN